MICPPPGKSGPGSSGSTSSSAASGLRIRRPRLRDFAQVVRRNLGGHADGDARGAVQQHEGQAAGSSCGSRMAPS